MSKGASFLVGCGLGVVVLLGVGLVVFWRGKKAEDKRRSFTEGQLRLLASVVAKRIELEGRPPVADGTGEDWSGQGAVGFIHPLDDGWGNRVRYRCPGPVHKKGWDLWSCGPNGKDDQGTFDDILVGEDIAPVKTGD